MDRDLSAYVARQAEWSARAFGPGLRTKGLIEHIRKELLEITENPTDLEEWIDVITLGFDGYWRNGGWAGDIIKHLQAKQDKNFRRDWPAPVSEDEPVEHKR